MALKDLKKKYWELFSKKIKLDYSEDKIYTRCFTCGKFIKIGTLDCHGGHFFPKGTYPALYFHPNNVRPQCYNCNVVLSGNLKEYEKRLKEEIGEEAFEELKSQRHSMIKITQAEYKELISNLKSL